MARSNWTKLGVDSVTKAIKGNNRNRGRQSGPVGSPPAVATVNPDSNIMLGGPGAPGGPEASVTGQVPPLAANPAKEKGDKQAEPGASILEQERPKVNLNIDFSDILGENKPKTQEQQVKDEAIEARSIEIINRVMQSSSNGFTAICNWFAKFFNWHIPPENISTANSTANDLFYIILPKGMPNIFAIPLLIGSYLTNFVPKKAENKDKPPVSEAKVNEN